MFGNEVRIFKSALDAPRDIKQYIVAQTKVLMVAVINVLHINDYAKEIK